MHLQQLFFEIFGKQIDDLGSETLLQEAIKQYPYFGPAHFFSLKKTVPGANDYAKKAGMAALHFDNPFLLNYRLGKDELTEEVVLTEVIPGSEMKEVTPVVEKAEEVATVKAVNEEPMIFEPLFATDYFASQGIKLSEEVQPGDKLGKQLKSFTEWLKSMKKIHEGKLPAGSEQIDLAVQNLAEKSNREDAVLTESMAEAYLQQGKPKKAVEILEKLSLLNPAKSAYFAAKIEQAGLKQ